MFKKQIFIFSFSLIVLTLLLLIPLFRITHEEKRGFDKLLEKTSKKKNQKGELSYTESIREGVVKEVWFQGETPLHLQITSAESALFFFNEGKNIEVVEQLGDVVCLMQEKLWTSKNGEKTQEVRYLKAKVACYNYNTALFVAEDVFLSKYLLPGHTLPKTVPEIKPIMQGTADNVEFALKGEKIDFKAEKLKASFDSKKRLL